MAVIVYAESWNGCFKKATYEAVNYAAQLANKIGTSTIAITIAHQGDANELGTYGANKIITISDNALSKFNNQAYANAIVAVANQESADVVIISNTNNGKSIAPTIAAILSFPNSFQFLFFALYANKKYNYEKVSSSNGFVKQWRNRSPGHSGKPGSIFGYE